VRDAAGELADRLHLGRLRDLALEPRFLAIVLEAEQHRRIAEPARAGDGQRDRLVGIRDRRQDDRVDQRQTRKSSPRPARSTSAFQRRREPVAAFEQVGAARAVAPGGARGAGQAVKLDGSPRAARRGGALAQRRTTVSKRRLAQTSRPARSVTATAMPGARSRLTVTDQSGCANSGSRSAGRRSGSVPARKRRALRSPPTNPAPTTSGSRVDRTRAARRGGRSECERRRRPECQSSAGSARSALGSASSAPLIRSARRLRRRRVPRVLVEGAAALADPPVPAERDEIRIAHRAVTTAMTTGRTAVTSVAPVSQQQSSNGCAPSPLDRLRSRRHRVGMEAQLVADLVGPRHPGSAAWSTGFVTKVVSAATGTLARYRQAHQRREQDLGERDDDPHQEPQRDPARDRAAGEAPQFRARRANGRMKRLRSISSRVGMLRCAHAS
jgi:hypothetical protein